MRDIGSADSQSHSDAVTKRHSYRYGHRQRQVDGETPHTNKQTPTHKRGQPHIKSGMHTQADIGEESEGERERDTG